MNETPDMTKCAEVADDLGALAAGALTGRDRVEVLDHVEHCASCTVELEALAMSADALLLLYPEDDPGTGFTDRVLARLEQEREQRPQRHRSKWLALAVAASIVALALAGLAVVLTSVDRPGPTKITAALESPSGPKGSVVLSSLHGDWLVMTLDDAEAPGTVTCRVTLSDGSTRTVGEFRLHGGYGTWAVRLPAAPSSVEAVTVIGQDGTVVASATV